MRPRKVYLLGIPRTGSSILRKLLISTGRVTMPAETPGEVLADTSRSFWSAWHWSPENYYRDEWDFGGYDAYNKDIKKVYPVNPMHHTPIMNMEVMRHYYRGVVDHVFNPSGISVGPGDWIGIKDVRNAGESVSICRFLRNTHENDCEFKVVTMCRHPYYQIRSFINAPWNNGHYSSEKWFVRGLFERKLEKWCKDMDQLCIAHGENTDAKAGAIYHYEDMEGCARNVFKELGLEWSEEQDKVLSVRFNHSPVKKDLDVECAEKAHTTYMEHDFIKRFPPGKLICPY